MAAEAAPEAAVAAAIDRSPFPRFEPEGNMSTRETKTQSDIPEERRREVFAAVVEEQDREASVLQSRAQVSRRFGITITQVREIESEGIDNGWPPL